MLGWVWMDPLMGIVGSLVIARWSYGLLRETSAVLLDGGVSEETRETVRAALESGTGLHGVLAQVAPERAGTRLAMIEAKDVAYDVIEAPAVLQMARGIFHERFQHLGTRSDRLLATKKAAVILCEQTNHSRSA